MKNKSDKESTIVIHIIIGFIVLGLIIFTVGYTSYQSGYENGKADVEVRRDGWDMFSVEIKYKKAVK